jgi:hypothetical protein
MGSACEDAVLLVDCSKRRTRTSLLPEGHSAAEDTPVREHIQAGELCMRKFGGSGHLLMKIRVNKGSYSPVFPASNSQHKLCYRPGVRRKIEIWRVAVLMVNRYADEAEANSFQRAEELAAKGDHAGAAIWRRVTVAIEQLTDTTTALIMVGSLAANYPDHNR